MILLARSFERWPFPTRPCRFFSFFFFSSSVVVFNILAQDVRLREAPGLLDALPGSPKWVLGRTWDRVFPGDRRLPGHAGHRQAAGGLRQLHPVLLRFSASWKCVFRGDGSKWD